VPCELALREHFEALVKVLVTGGTGVIGSSAVDELLRRGHHVRLLSRNAERHAEQWAGVEAFPGDIRDRASIAGACDGCDVVIHLAGVGTRNIVSEAEAAGVRRFIFVSSLGAEGDDEAVVSASRLRWTIVRPAHVYGPGDDVISQIVKMIRALPAMPIIERGDEEFQPIWHEDVAAALAMIAERDDLAGQTLEVAGPETTSMNDLVKRLSAITDRHPLPLPLPHAVAPSEGVLSGTNALTTILGINPTPLGDGLRKLAHTMPEQLPEEGVGALSHKRFVARIRGSRMTAGRLMTMFRNQFAELVPLDFTSEPHATTAIERGNTLTMSLPLRGNAQVRIEVVEPQRLVLATIEGHPLAGAVRFTTADVADGVEFAIDTYTRSANVLDWIANKTVGSLLQDANWKRVVQRVIDLSGGTADAGIQTSAQKLDDAEASEIEKSLRLTIEARKRKESAEDAPQR
jgi:uncharacterized protein YbjT (DUF2867 family)